MNQLMDRKTFKRIGDVPSKWRGCSLEGFRKDDRARCSTWASGEAIEGTFR